MIEPLINRTIDNRWIVLGLTLILVGFGLFAVSRLRGSNGKAELAIGLFLTA